MITDRQLDAFRRSGELFVDDVPYPESHPRWTLRDLAQIAVNANGLYHIDLVCNSWNVAECTESTADASLSLWQWLTEAAGSDDPTDCDIPRFDSRRQAWDTVMGAFFCARLHDETTDLIRGSRIGYDRERQEFWMVFVTKSGSIRLAHRELEQRENAPGEYYPIEAIENLDISVRSKNQLRKANIRTITELREHSRTQLVEIFGGGATGRHQAESILLAFKKPIEPQPVIPKSRHERFREEVRSCVSQLVFKDKNLRTVAVTSLVHDCQIRFETPSDWIVENCCLDFYEPSSVPVSRWLIDQRNLNLRYETGAGPEDDFSRACWIYVCHAWTFSGRDGLSDEPRVGFDLNTRHYYFVFKTTHDGDTFVIRLRPRF